MLSSDMRYSHVVMEAMRFLLGLHTSATIAFRHLGLLPLSTIAANPMVGLFSEIEGNSIVGKLVTVDPSIVALSECNSGACASQALPLVGVLALSKDGRMPARPVRASTCTSQTLAALSALLNGS